MYKLVIPTAGFGTRSGCTLNKALTTVGDQPMITRVIDRFPNASEVIVILGHQGYYVLETLLAFYPTGKRIKFVIVDDATRGLGYTLRAARDELQCPFVFAPNDAIFDADERIPDPEKAGNWVGYHLAELHEDVSQYRTLELRAGCAPKLVYDLERINPRGTESMFIYTGVCGVRDYDKFWAAMGDPAAVEAGESHGLKALDNVTAHPFLTWQDGGAARSLAEAKRKIGSRYNVLEKPGEAIWFNHDGQVIKFSTDHEFIANRCKRCAYIDSGLLPNNIRQHSNNIYIYDRVEGRILSAILDPVVMGRLLEVMTQDVWSQRPRLQSVNYRNFYHFKTLRRLDEFFKRDECIDRKEIINGLMTPTIRELMEKLDWDRVCRRPSARHFHGDFHNENILVQSDGMFKLLDWRQDFDGDIEYGDVYYDLAKFLHGLLVEHAQVRNNQFYVGQIADNEVEITIRRSDTMIRTETAFYEWLTKHGYDIELTRTVTALIFLNIAALHHYPYSLFLYYKGKMMLAELIEKGGNVCAS